MTNFLPNGYELLKIEKPYWKMSQLKVGDNRMRIMMQAVAGWEDWKDKKPLRFRPENKPSKSIHPDKPIKPFWACYVWDYAREALFILEIVQTSLIRALTLIGQDEDWGDFTKYDIKINKQGSGETTKYTLTPLPHKPLTAKMEEALRECPVRLEALYESGDPWTDLVGIEVDEQTGEVPNSSPVSSPLETLRENLVLDGIETEHLESYLKELSEKKKHSVEQIINSALLPALLPKFKTAYLKDLEKRLTAVQEEIG